MSRKPTPPPESRYIGGGGAFAAGWTGLALLLSLVISSWWLMLFALPIVFYVGYLVHGLVLVAAAWRRWRGTSIRGILVCSNSPNWQAYIEERWLPRLDGRVIVLNWSERRNWSGSLPVRIFHRFGIDDDNFNFNPLLIVLRGLRHPFVYRYFYAFRDAKHGRPAALNLLEKHMFAQIEPAPK